MNVARLALAIAALSLVAPPLLHGDGPSLWNPFSSGEKKKPAGMRSTAKKPATKDSSWWKVPGLGGKTTKKPAARQGKQPSALTKASNSTKRFFTSAKDTLTPGSKKTVSKRPSGYGTSGGAKTAKKATARKAAAKKDEGNILTSWWKAKDPEPTRPKTVPDWMAGERP